MKVLNLKTPIDVNDLDVRNVRKGMRSGFPQVTLSSLSRSSSARLVSSLFVVILTPVCV